MRIRAPSATCGYISNPHPGFGLCSRNTSSAFALQHEFLRGSGGQRWIRANKTPSQAEAASSSSSYEPPEELDPGSEAWRSRKPAITLPKYARKAEHTFLLATLLKIMILASVFPMPLIFKPLGYTPQGIVAWLILVPAAAVLAFLAGVILQSDFLKRRRSGLAIVILSALLLTCSSQLYGYKRPAIRRSPKVTHMTAQEQEWQKRMLLSTEPRTAEDSNAMWEKLGKEQKPQKLP